MMAAWMVYTLLTTLLLVVAGAAAERTARALRAPTRAVWAFVIIASMSLSAVSLLGGRAIPTPVSETPVAQSDVSTRRAASAATDVADRGATLTLERLQPVIENGPRTRASRLFEAAVLRLDQARWERYDGVLIAICASLAMAGMFVVTVSLAHLSRMTRTLTPGEVEGTRVLLSNDLGPAVLGFLRLHVVIPRWVLALSSDERRTILLHEQQHAAERDPMLVLLGVIALALQPWNFPLWIGVARLRFALESDCDARVLQRGPCGARRYGTLLLRVHEHELVTRLSSRMPVTAFVDSTSHLERRVRRMTGRQPRVRSLSTAAAFVAAMLCVGVAFSVQVSNARVVAKAANAGPQTKRASILVPVAATPAPTTAESQWNVSPRWQDALPEFVNSQREAPRAAARLVAPAAEPRISFVARITPATRRGAFTPETLFVQPSNPKWPMSVRIITTTGDSMSYVTVTDTLGHQLPTADTLFVKGPVRLLLPDAPFQLRVESLGGDLSVTSSPVEATDGHGGHWVSTVIARILVASRPTAGAAAKFSSGEDRAYVSTKRVP